MPLPDPDEQEAIAAAVGDADAHIESLQLLITKKRHLKQGAMQELLTGKKRLAGFGGQWGVKPLGEGVRLISGQHVLARHCNIDGHGIPYITGPADFPEGVIQHTKFTTKPGTVCRSGDVLVTVKGSGAGTLVLARADYCISRQLMAVRVTQWNVNYVYFSLMQDASRFNAAATGLIPGLSRNDILTKPISLPPTQTEQAAIATVLCDMDAEIAALESRVAKARLVKQGMMQNLLTGRIRLV
jgi:type I restriction enzyme, S subunit